MPQTKFILSDLDKTLIHDPGVGDILADYLSQELSLDPASSSKLLSSFFKLQASDPKYLNTFSKVGVWKQLLKGQDISYSPQLLFELNQGFWQLVAGNVKLIDGVEQALQTLSDRGIQIIVVSGGDYISRYLQVQATGLLKFVSGLVSSEDYGVLKSEQDLYKLAAEEYGLEIAACLVVGDNEVDDVKLPKADGFTTVKVDPRKGESAADYKVASFSEVLQLDHLGL